MRVRFVPVDGDVMPAGVAVLVAEGDGEMVVQVATDYTLEDVCGALSTTLTAFLSSRFLYVGALSDDEAGVVPAD